MRLTRKRLTSLLVLLLVVGTASVSPWAYRRFRQQLAARCLGLARTAMEDADYASAESHARRVLNWTSSREARMVAGEAAMMAGRDAEALQYFEPLWRETDDEAIAVMAASADLYQRMGDSAEAERLYRRALALDPGQSFARQRLAYLLSLQGRRHESIPQLFELLNRGDGPFVDATQEAGFTGTDGKGLAIAAVDHDQSGQLDLFVSNDTTANFFYVNDGPRGALPRFTESAIVRGLAFDRRGQAQACMGIAIGDVNADNLLDVFVANFYRDFNVLYEQSEGGFFMDVSRERGVAESSYLMLTFGTEFIDMDLDGDLDLVVTNGHVDDLRDQGVPYHMPPQVLENVSGNFVDVSDHCGDFFQGAYLGRGLASLDWNRDGRGDWVVSHLDQPAALLENRTVSEGHFLGLSFVGTQSHRDAIGVTCRVTVRGETHVQQLVGGGGYHTSNEKLLLFGLGEATNVDQLEIRWPAGQVRTFRDVPGDRFYRVVEGQDVLHPLEMESVPTDGATSTASAR